MFDCTPIIVVDGDTIRCGQERVRLMGIDAPELGGHCRPGRVCTPGDGEASRRDLRQIVASSRVRCHRAGFDRYGRTLAHCYIRRAGRVKINIGCEMVQIDAAVLRYGGLACQPIPRR